MPRKSDSIAIANPLLDRRVKLSEMDRENIRKDYAMGTISTRGLAVKYGVSRRLIQFVLDPQKEERRKELAKERRKDGRYYDREKNTESMREHRNYKKALYQQGLLIGK